MTDFIKNIWNVRQNFIQLQGVDLGVMPDQMLLHRNESSDQKTMSS